MDNGACTQTKSEMNQTIASKITSSPIKDPTPKGMSVKIFKAMEIYRRPKTKKTMNGGNQATSSSSASNIW